MQFSLLTLVFIAISAVSAAPTEKRALPSSFSWSATDALVSAKSDSHDIAGIKG